MSKTIAPTKTCCVCGEYAGFYWIHNGVERFYCRDDYHEAELQMHKAEKEKRLVAMTFGVISGITPEFDECIIGKHCPWCLEVGLRQDEVIDLVLKDRKPTRIPSNPQSQSSTKSEG